MSHQQPKTDQTNSGPGCVGLFWRVGTGQKTRLRQSGAGPRGRTHRAVHAQPHHAVSELQVRAHAAPVRLEEDVLQPKKRQGEHHVARCETIAWNETKRRETKRNARRKQSAHETRSVTPYFKHPTLLREHLALDARASTWDTGKNRDGRGGVTGLPQRNVFELVPRIPGAAQRESQLR